MTARYARKKVDCSYPSSKVCRSARLALIYIAADTRRVDTTESSTAPLLRYEISQVTGLHAAMISYSLVGGVAEREHAPTHARVGGREHSAGESSDQWALCFYMFACRAYMHVCVFTHISKHI